MKISLNWVKDYVDLPDDLDLQRLCYDLTMATVEVEGAVYANAALENIVVGSIERVEPIPDTDHLRAAVCDVGGKKLDIVCGAANIVPGMLVPIALPGATIQPHGKGPLMEVRKVRLRNRPSEAVICAASEIGLGGLFRTREDEIPDLAPLGCQPGQPMAAVVGWNDIVFEIDNKSLTNRPDLWGHYGIARELAAIYDRPLKELPRPQAFPVLDELACQIENPELCRRYVTTRIEGVKVQPAPFWMRSRLALLGHKPINLFVDLTNYIMLAVGQPSHAFDAAKLDLPLKVRSSTPEERLTLLDGDELDLAPGSFVIADRDKPVALAGVMGGLATSVTADSDTIILECANFHPLAIRRSAGKYGKRTESSSRYEKSLDPDRIDEALALFHVLLQQTQPEARIAGMNDVYPTRLPEVTVRLTLDFLESRLGLRLEESLILRILNRLGFGVTLADGVLTVAVPHWRATGDVSLPEDIVEEVARLYGYDHFTFIAPKIDLDKPVLQPRVQQERRIRQYLAFSCGMRELLTYPWVDDAMIAAVGMDDLPTVNLEAPPAPDQRRLRSSLVPNMVKAVADNLRFYSSFKIFELGQTFHATTFQSPDEPRELLPVQTKRLAAAIVGDDLNALFREAKGVIEGLGRLAQVQEVHCGERPSEIPAWADPGACVELLLDGRAIGLLGLLSSRTKRAAGVKHGHAVLFEMEVDGLAPLPSRDNRFKQLPKYPQVDFDISLLFPVKVAWRDVQREAGLVHELIGEVLFVDEYRGKGIPEGSKSVTLRLRLGSPEGTLTAEQAADVASQVTTHLKQTLDARDR